MNRFRVTRRTMLRGLGASIALPWMESMPVWGDETSSDRKSNEPPLRFAVVFAGNGFHKDHWWAKGNGTGMELGRVLEPLAP
ncbi:MAG TPA: DUF1552 domain-containing protein, partial [Planctomycetaceae bacterium]|nr:DUF1552 domain-containing protein [Planctomycetaceae bacterium]